MDELIILYCFIILIIIGTTLFNRTEKFLVQDILDTNDENLIMVKLFKDIDSIFSHYNINYQIFEKSNNNFTLIISEKNEQGLINLESWFNNAGYGLVSSWNGYKIYPFSGINIEYSNSQYLREPQDKQHFNFKYPFATILIFKNNDFANRYVKRAYENNSRMDPLTKSKVLKPRNYKY